MYTVRNNLIKTQHIQHHCPLSNKSKSSLFQTAARSHHIYSATTVLSQITSLLIPPWNQAHHWTPHPPLWWGQKHILQPSPSFSSWWQSGSITLKASLHHLFFALIRAEASLCSFLSSSSDWPLPHPTPHGRGTRNVIMQGLSLNKLCCIYDPKSFPCRSHDMVTLNMLKIQLLLQRDKNISDVTWTLVWSAGLHFVSVSLCF